MPDIHSTMPGMTPFYANHFGHCAYNTKIMLI